MKSHRRGCNDARHRYLRILDRDGTLYPGSANWLSMGKTKCESVKRSDSLPGHVLSAFNIPSRNSRLSYIHEISIRHDVHSSLAMLSSDLEPKA